MKQISAVLLSFFFFLVLALPAFADVGTFTASNYCYNNGTHQLSYTINSASPDASSTTIVEVGLDGYSTSWWPGIGYSWANNLSLSPGTTSIAETLAGIGGDLPVTDDATTHTVYFNGVDGSNNYTRYVSQGITGHDLLLCNQPPVMSQIPTMTFGSGATYWTSGSFTDTTATSWTATVDYGDGGGTQPLQLSGQSYTLKHTYTTTGTFTIKVLVTNNQGATGESDATVTVISTSSVYGTFSASNYCYNNSTHQLSYTINSASPDASAVSIDEIGLDQYDTNWYQGIATSWSGTGYSWANNLSLSPGTTSVSEILNGLNYDLPVTDDATIHALYFQGSDGSNYKRYVSQPITGHDLLSCNQPPVVNSLSGATINEGSTYSATGSFTDPDSTSWTATVDYGDGSGSQSLTLSGMNFSLSHVYKDNGTYTVTVSVTDNQGATATGTATVTVNNVAPTVGAITAPSSPVLVNTAITASANFTDPGVLDTHTASWNWGDGNTTTGTVIESNGSGSVSDNHTYTATGVYMITLTVTDKDGGVGTSTFPYIAVYDSTSSFAGGRSFDNPSTASPSTSGKVSFGVSAKYNNSNVLTGNAKMNFKAANLDFASTSLSSLATSNGKAYLNGSGTLNGTSGYTFLATGIDGSVAGGSDMIRFQIKDSSGTVVYDSQPGAGDTADPTTTDATGNIRVH